MLTSLAQIEMHSYFFILLIKQDSSCLMVDSGWL